MKLPDALKHAVLTQDWEVVCKVYTTITGEPLEVPKPKEPDWSNIDIAINPQPTTTSGGSQPAYPTVKQDKDFWLKTPEADDKDVEAMVKDIDDNVGKGEPIFEKPEIPEGTEDFMAPSRTEDALDSKKFGRKERIIQGERQNRFSDNPEVLAEVAGIGPPPKQHRKKKDRSLVTVVCAGCNQTFEVSPMLSRGYDPDPEMNRYHCNDCLASRGKTR